MNLKVNKSPNNVPRDYKNHKELHVNKTKKLNSSTFEKILSENSFKNNPYAYNYNEKHNINPKINHKNITFADVLKVNLLNKDIKEINKLHNSKPKINPYNKFENGREYTSTSPNQNQNTNRSKNNMTNRTNNTNNTNNISNSSNTAIYKKPKINIRDNSNKYDTTATQNSINENKINYINNNYDVFLKNRSLNKFITNLNTDVNVNDCSEINQENKINSQNQKQNKIDLVNNGNNGNNSNNGNNENYKVNKNNGNNINDEPVKLAKEGKEEVLSPNDLLTDINENYNIVNNTNTNENNNNDDDNVFEDDRNSLNINEVNEVNEINIYDDREKEATENNDEFNETNSFEKEERIFKVNFKKQILEDYPLNYANTLYEFVNSLDPVLQSLSLDEKIVKFLNHLDDPRRPCRLGALHALYILKSKNLINDSYIPEMLVKVIDNLRNFEIQEELYLIASLEMLGNTIKQLYYIY